MIVINYNPSKSKHIITLTIQFTLSFRSSDVVWIIIVHLNTLINEASSSETLFINQHFVSLLGRYCCTFYNSLLFLLANSHSTSVVRRRRSEWIKFTCNMLKHNKETFKSTEVCFSIRKKAFKKGHKKSLRVLFLILRSNEPATSRREHTHLFCSVEDPIKRLNNSIFHHQRTWSLWHE